MLISVSVTPHHPTGQRSRAGLGFSRDPRVVDVTNEALIAIQADEYLSVEVLDGPNLTATYVEDATCEVAPIPTGLGVLVETVEAASTEAEAPVTTTTADTENVTPTDDIDSTGVGLPTLEVTPATGAVEKPTDSIKKAAKRAAGK